MSSLLDLDVYLNKTLNFGDAYAEALDLLRRTCTAAGYECSESEDQTWCYFRPLDHRDLPTRGWKAHLSSSCVRAPSLLAVLAKNADVFGHQHFKVLTKGELVIKLNSGLLGETQVGKIVTIYGQDSCVFPASLRMLSRLWHDENSPAVPSDVYLSDNPSISLRFGALTGGETRLDEWGVPLLRHRDEEGIFEDDRSRNPAEFLADAPIPCLVSKNGLGFGDVIRVEDRNYCVLHVLSQSPKGSTALASDSAATTCVLKVARRGVLGDILGNDARSRLQNEARVLRRLAEAQFVPKLIAFSQDDNALLVRQDIEGNPICRDDLEHQDCIFSLAEIIDQMHSLGVVHRDLKPDNIIVKGGRAFLIDFELAVAQEDDHVIPGGSCNYYPENNPVARTVSVDQYGFAGTYASLLLGFDVARLRASSSLIFDLLTNQGYVAQAATYRNLIQGHYYSFLHAARDIVSLGRDTSRRKIKCILNTTEIARQAAIKVVETGGSVKRGQVFWRNRHLFQNVIMPGVNGGVAGVIFGLWALGRLLETSEFEESIVGGARWLTENHRETAAGGMFTGDAGIALALGVAGHVTGKSHFLVEAKRRMLRAEHTPILDLFSGQAGVALVGCLLCSLLDDRSWLKFSDRAITRLLQGGPIEYHSLLVWPSTAQAKPSTFLLGAAHGAAGIAAALSWVGREIANASATRVASDALKKMLLFASASGRGYFPRSTEWDRTPPMQWCHGMAGLLWSSSAIAGSDPAVDNLRIEVARTILQSELNLHDTTMCHGLSGLYEATAKLCGHAQIEECRNRIIGALGCLFDPGGTYPWSSEDRTLFAPDIWIGALAPALTLARHKHKHVTFASIFDPQTVQGLSRR